MYAFSVAAGSKDELYRDLLSALDALTADEADGVANMANAAALLWEYLPDLNWAGFYRAIGDELVLGAVPGQGGVHPHQHGARGCAAPPPRPARHRWFADVHAFPGHIACDAASRSELVVPIVRDGGGVIAVIDLDSPVPARFDDDDARGCEALARLLAGRIG